MRPDLLTLLPLQGRHKVRVDGAHRVAQVEAQMSLPESTRGPRAHAQLIGGEVSLLDPEDHAAALSAMRKQVVSRCR